MLLRKSILRNPTYLTLHKQVFRFYTVPQNADNEQPKIEDSKLNQNPKVPLRRQLFNFSDMFFGDENAKRIVEDVRKRSPFFKNAETIFTMLRIMNLIVVVAFGIYLIWFYYHMYQNSASENDNTRSKIE